MSESAGTQVAKLLVDEYGNIHQTAAELARGGQGIVFRTKDSDLAVKQPLDASGQQNRTANLRECFQAVRLLPIPPRLPVSLPLAILRDEPGYVMRLLNDMKPFTIFELNGKAKKQLEDDNSIFPEWLASIPNKEMAQLLLHYARTGSTRSRLVALAKCAAILARLHSAGLVYGDISTNNVFVGEKAHRDVWLIDADNIRYEQLSSGISVYTPGYGAPEVVRGIAPSRPRTDCWAFAVLAFKLLALCHPFIGRKVLEPDEEENGWDAELQDDQKPADLDEQAFAGYLPFVDDEDDDSNSGTGGLPRDLVTTPQLRRLFQETFGAGREQPHRRPVMAFWALELTKAADKALDCPKCAMSYFVDTHECCPYCDNDRPAFIRIKTSRWEIITPASTTEFSIPHRMFHPFSFERHDDTEYESIFSFSAKTAVPVRGERALPEGLTFKFVEGGK